MKSILRNVGKVMAVTATIGMSWHRFLHPDMTEVRWLINFWYIWLGWYLLIVVSVYLFTLGDNEIPKKTDSDGGLERVINRFFHLGK